jgi:hypothetical protein
MPTFKCPKCKAEVSVDEAACPACGHVLITAADAAWKPSVPVGKVFENKNRPWQVAVVLALCVALVVFFFVFLHDKKAIFSDYAFEVSPSQSRAFDFVLGKKVTMVQSLEVLSGPPVDVYLMDEAQYNRYRDSLEKRLPGQVEHQQVLGALGTRGVTQSAELSRNSYYLVVRTADPLKMLEGANTANVSKVKMSLVAEW